MSIKVKNPDPQFALEIVTQIVQRVPEVITSTIAVSYTHLIESYNRSVEQLKDGQKLQQDLGMDAQFWKQVKFLTMDSYE